jgi:DNA-binding transcriptional MerR regulator
MMGYHIGEVAGFLDITPDTIRFYEKEGIIRPYKNKENGYREYGFEDISRLSDILFYRNVDFSIGDIRKIVNGVSSEEMLTMIREKEQEVSKSLAFYGKLLIKMQNWEKLHREALEFENRFELRPMPSSYHKRTYKDKGAIDIHELTQSIPVSPEDAYFVTLSFRCDLPGVGIEHYFALDTEYAGGLDVDFSNEDFEVETHPRCLFTVCKYQDDFGKMLKPTLTYLKANNLEPVGIVYGRQSVVTYENDQPVEHYRIYLPLKGISKNPLTLE